MKNNKSDIKSKLVDKGMKVTPQRIAILEALYNLDNHPTAEMIIEHIRDNNPGIALATIYKVLDAFEDYGLAKKVKTDLDIKRYDGNTSNHHHLYGKGSDEIKDYTDIELDKYLLDYFRKNMIDGFEVEEIKLQIHGKFHKSAKKDIK